MTCTDTQTQIDFFVDEKMQLKDQSKNTSGMTIYELIIKFIEANRRFFWSGLSFQRKKKAFSCSKSTIETLEQGVKYVQS